MDWTELNHDLLLLIAKKVKDISHFVRLRTVCKRWRSIVHLSDTAPQFPCNINYNENCSSFDIQLHKSFSQRVHSVLINNIFVKQEHEKGFMHCSLSGILLLRTGNYLNPWVLFNPLSGFHTLLPRQKDGSFVQLIYCGHSCRPKTKTIKNCIDVVFIFYEYNKQDSSSPGDYKIGLWQYDHIKWTRIGRLVPLCVDKEFVTYCNNGRLCFVSHETGHTRVIDVETEKVTVIRDRGPCLMFMYMVEEGGDLICVFTNFIKFEVYLLEDFDTNPRLRKLKAIGRRVIFINCRYNAHAMCLKVTDCESYRNNCIYFEGCQIYDIENDNRYDIENDNTEMTLTYDFRYNWFVPSLL